MHQSIAYQSAIPIDLNIDTFQRCGFQYNESVVSLYLSPLHLMKHGDGWHMQQSQGYIGTKILHYLHELQNLYFDLTGKELKYKFQDLGQR